MDVIRAENLTKAFDGLTAVSDITFTVAEGEIFGLVGPDGAGKTTTMRLLTSIMEPILIIVMGVVVGFIVIALYMPLIKIAGNISG